MKKIYLALAALPIIALASCTDDGGDEPWSRMVTDVYPIIMDISFTDASGRDLLNTKGENSLFGSAMTVEYEGESYDCDWSDPWGSDDLESKSTIGSRYYPATFKGLYLSYILVQDEDGSWTRSEDYIIKLGDLPGDEDYDKTMTLRWNDGNREERIRITNRFYWEKNEPNRETHYYHNGIECGRTITLVK